MSRRVRSLATTKAGTLSSRAELEAEEPQRLEDGLRLRREPLRRPPGAGGPPGAGAGRGRALFLAGQDEASGAVALHHRPPRPRQEDDRLLARREVDPARGDAAAQELGDPRLGVPRSVP